MEILKFYRICRNLTILTVIGLAVSCSTDYFEPEPLLEVDLTTSTKNSKVVKDQYIIILSKKPAKKDPVAEAALEALTNEVRGMSNARIKGVFKSTLTGFAAKLDTRQLEIIKRDKRVEAVFPDELVELEDTGIITNLSTTNVQEYATWGLDRIDQRENILNRSYAYTATGSGINAYIMDSGIRFSHNEFGQRASLGIDLVKDFPDEFDEDDPNLEKGNDCNGHGTHVAATVGGMDYGIAKEVNLVSVRVFSCVGRTPWSRLIQAVEWVTDNAIHPAVVNMSLGGNGYEPMDTAIENSVATGVHYVVSAGNANSDACDISPARTPGAITVGSTNIDNVRSYFSNYGECLDLYAPGNDITSASHKDNISVVKKSGTSMAAPHITGLAALYLQNKSNISPAELQEAIVSNSTPGVVENVPSGPNLLAHSLWEPVVFTPPSPPNLNLRVIGFKNGGSSDIYLVWDRTDDPFVSVYRNGSYFAQWYNTGEYKLSTKGKGGDTFKVCEYNYNNCSAELAADFSETDFVPNQPPTANFSYEVNDLEVTFQDLSTDSDGFIAERKLFFGDGYYTPRESFVYTYREPGIYNVKLEVYDDHRNSDYIYKEITVGTVVAIPVDLELTAVGSKVKGVWQTDLSWTPAGSTAEVDIYRNSSFLRTIENTGSYKDVTNFKGGGTLTYKVCESGTANCSSTISVQF